MIAYIDTSALLRIVLREPDALDQLRSYDALVSSELWRDRMGPLTTMATHDTALGLAARVFGFEVIGA